ncbi:ROK family transcriptional regulator [Spirilliplanes yamanashiensis]|uniref:Transcriptional regulator n=1 Tax=Spirilliplanes yamanashiensis TaxID=42233 RepID=A0A8J3Y5G8_9ACTN|nr:ROK family transcriptional regulator [Spirilliplanes yamanashiensis]MDP9814539.1 putative NBD/HSP70 family sugar kinase [Spirilliplanes yamanashiensis]GIJ02191.1 transcriptional regulator [Spirilliplanes yamanashiensis]
MNESAALAHLLERGQLTRADLRALTTLSTPTISEVLRRLVDSGLVTIAGRVSGRPGPHAEIYAVNADAAYTAAISVRDAMTTGVPTLTAALCDLTGVVRARVESSIDFEATDPVDAVVELVERLHTESGVPTGSLRYVQLGVAGSYDPFEATIKHSDIPNWERPGLVPEIGLRLGTQVGVENDVNLAAVAERERGVAREADGFALVWLGEEGLGAAIDINGVMLRGARGGAGEIGYMPMSAAGSADDACGEQTVSLQELVGGPAVLELATAHGIPGDTPAEAVAAAAADPENAGKFLDVLARRVSVAIAAIVAVLDPALVVLAGQVSQAGGEVLRDAVSRALTRTTPLETSIEVTAIHDDAVLLGALDAGLAEVRQSLLDGIRDKSAP